MVCRGVEAVITKDMSIHQNESPSECNLPNQTQTCQPCPSITLDIEMQALLNAATAQATLALPLILHHRLVDICSVRFAASGGWGRRKQGQRLQEVQILRCA
eukprot:m.465140 g.465140  ORF g.465140 m.465140 type:complete len:102 (-) comp23998_c0_seq1:70-375(-)